MTTRAPDHPTVRIERLAAGGDGVGKLEDGRTLFVPRAAAGDLIEIEGLTLHKRFARGRIGRIIESGPGRVKPRCLHYDRDRCGGCQWQHLDEERQIAAKSAVIGDALRRLGKLDVRDPEVVPSAVPFGYRNKVTLARGKNGALGLHREGEAGQVFPLERCELIAPALQEAWARLRPIERMLPRETERVVFRLDRDGGVHLIVETQGQHAWTKVREFSELLGQGPAADGRVSSTESPEQWNAGRGPAAPAGRSGTIDPLKGRPEGSASVPVVLWWHPEGGSPRVVAGGDGRTAYPATVFEQVNPAMGDQVREWAVAQAGEVAGMHCWDLYAGIGETTAMLVERGATVESVEGDRRAVEQAMKHPALRTPHFGRAIAGKVEVVISELRAPALIITNPPRVGMEAAAVEGIRRAAPKRIVYVSCDPATLARDVQRLGSGWKVVALRGFDLFPQTAHVETVLVLEAA